MTIGTKGLEPIELDAMENERLAEELKKAKACLLYTSDAADE